jgi:hypothetical protein
MLMRFPRVGRDGDCLQRTERKMQEYLTNWRNLVFKSVQISSGRLLSPKLNVNKYTVLSNMEYLINLDKTGIRLQFPTLRM